MEHVSEMLAGILMETLMITSIVMVIMVLIEYFNVHSSGSFGSSLQHSQWKQILFSAIIGVTPGCLGIYTIVSLYTHRIIGFAGLLAATIATVGDEAYVMFSVIPSDAFKLMLILFFLALVSGFLIALLVKRPGPLTEGHFHEMHHHEHQEGRVFDMKTIKTQLLNISFPRAVLIFGLSVYILGLVTGFLVHDESMHGHGHEAEHAAEPAWDFLRITSLVGAVIALFIMITVPEHFLEHHLWGHVIKRHFLRIFLWTLGALLTIEILIEFMHLENWMRSNPATIMVLALLVGIIPISGPHIFFISLFAAGTIPFSILLANSIVQDGHGALPLFAESKLSFIKVKGVKLIIGLIVGMAGLWAGF